MNSYNKNCFYFLKTKIFGRLIEREVNHISGNQAGTAIERVDRGESKQQVEVGDDQNWEGDQMLHPGMGPFLGWNIWSKTKGLGPKDSMEFPKRMSSEPYHGRKNKVCVQGQGYMYMEGVYDSYDPYFYLVEGESLSLGSVDSHTALKKVDRCACCLESAYEEEHITRFLF